MRIFFVFIMVSMAMLAHAQETLSKSIQEFVMNYYSSIRVVDNMFCFIDSSNGVIYKDTLFYGDDIFPENATAWDTIQIITASNTLHKHYGQPINGRWSNDYLCFFLTEEDVQYFVNIKFCDDTLKIRTLKAQGSYSLIGGKQYEQDNSRSIKSFDKQLDRFITFIQKTNTENSTKMIDGILYDLPYSIYVNYRYKGAQGNFAVVDMKIKGRKKVVRLIKSLFEK